MTCSVNCYSSKTVALVLEEILEDSEVNIYLNVLKTVSIIKTLAMF